MHHFTRKKITFLSIIIFCLLLFITLFFFNQYQGNTTREQYHKHLLDKMTTSDSFREFTSCLFCYEVTSDSITTAYHLRQPSSYDIPELPAVLSGFSYEKYEKDRKNNASQKRLAILSDSLTRFPYSELSSSEQLTYNLLKNHLQLNNSLTYYAYYDELLGSTTGIQANLPVTLSEYPLPDENAVKTYLNLLTQVPDYFENVILYEKKRKNLGYQTPDFILASTKKEMKSLLENLKQDDNCFVSTFHQRISDIGSLSDQKKRQYKKQNQLSIQKYILPAYETLYQYVNSTLDTKDSNESSDSSDNNTALSSHANEAYGLSTFPKGTDYYTLLVKNSTGSNRSVSELIAITNSALKQALGNVLNIALTDPDAYTYYCEHPLESYYESPEAILESLSLMIHEDYPVLSPTPQYTVKNVPKSLASSLSPAFYMIPAMDDYKHNTIYINSLYTNEENGNLFTTLAHEGFPGHLYQTVYFNQTKPDPIRQILDYPGYVEGWATYVEMDAFTFLDYPIVGDSLCKLYQNDTIINLALCSRIDLGVNYENWTLEDTRHFFEENGFRDYYAENVYSYVVEAPANYLSYFIGYLEIQDLKTAYKNLKMEQFSEKDFHKAFLDIGPADFDTIRNYLIPTTASDGS